MYMHWFKKTYVFGEDSRFKENIVFWKRQMDDIFFVWKGAKKELELFVWHLNGVEYKVQFTLEVERRVFAFSGCWNHQCGREIKNKGAQKTDAYTAIY